MRRILHLSCLLAASIAALTASPITYSTTFAEDFDFDATLFLPKFQLAGKLTKVQLDLQATVDSTVGFENRANQNRTITPSFESNITALVAGGLLSLSIDPTRTGSPISVQRSDRLLDFGGASGFSWSASASGSASVESTASEVFAALTGPGNFVISLVGTGATDLTGTQGSNWSSFGDMTSNVALEVTYFYTPVPEPAITGMTGAALLAIGMAAQRRLRR